jgi:phage-related protein
MSPTREWAVAEMSFVRDQAAARHFYWHKPHGHGLHMVWT